jgi:hypothetical protein
MTFLAESHEGGHTHKKLEQFIIAASGAVLFVASLVASRLFSLRKHSRTSNRSNSICNEKTRVKPRVGKAKVAMHNSIRSQSITANTKCRSTLKTAAKERFSFRE